MSPAPSNTLAQVKLHPKRTPRSQAASPRKLKVSLNGVGHRTKYQYHPYHAVMHLGNKRK